MDLRQITMFLAVIESGGFTQAGKMLGVSQSAISRKIGLLEEELGDKLFFRLHQRVRLTNAGLALHRYALRISRDLRYAALEVSEIASLNRGHIKIAAGLTACVHIVPSVLELFRKQHPNIELQVRTGSASDLVHQVRNNSVDLAVLALPLEASDLEVIPLFSEEMVVVTSSKHAELSNRRTIRATELARYPMILYNRGASTRRLVEAFFERLGIKPNIVMESEHMATITPFVAVNLGVSLLPLSAVLFNFQKEKLHYLRITDKPLWRQSAIVLQISDCRPNALVELITLFQDAVNAAANVFVPVSCKMSSRVK